jgi:NB-ARC domain
VGVLALPTEFVAREELAVVCEALLGEGKGAVGVTGHGLGLHGQGGIGKTILAAAVANDSEIRRHFPDRVLWITLGEGADPCQRSARSAHAARRGDRRAHSGPGKDRADAGAGEPPVPAGRG